MDHKLATENEVTIQFIFFLANTITRSRVRGLWDHIHGRRRAKAWYKLTYVPQNFVLTILTWEQSGGAWSALNVD